MAGSEQIKMKLEVLKMENMGVLRTHFMQKVQLEEQRDENEVNLHYYRGVIDGIDAAVRAIADIQKGEELEKLKEKRQQDAERLAQALRDKRQQESLGLANLPQDDHQKTGVKVL